MDTLVQLRETFWSYVSPRKPPTKEQRVKRPQQPKKQRHSIGDKLDKRAISPTKRTHQWLARPVPQYANPHEPTTVAKKHKNKTLGGRVTKPSLPTPSLSGSPRQPRTTISTSEKSKGNPLSPNGVEKHDFEIDETLVEEGSPADVEDVSEDVELEDTTLVEDEMDSEPTLAKEQQPQQQPEQELTREELRKQREAMVNANSAGWTSDENRLYRVITMRGFEALFPQQWRMDFQALPSGLFCYTHETAFFNATKNSDFHGARALYRLMSLGKGVRERILLKQAPEPYIKREIEAYISWSEKDGGFAKKQHTPLIAMATPRDKASARDSKATHHLENQVRRKLSGLASRYRSAFAVHRSVEGQSTTETPTDHDARNAQSTPALSEFSHQPPTLYGMLILHSVVAIATYNSANPNSPLRTVAILDLGKNGQDVWNGIAIGAAVICARDWLCRSEPLQAEKEISDTSDDPDA